MKVMMFVKGTEGSEAGAPPTPEAIQAMHDYNEALSAAGVLKDEVYGGLMPTRVAKRIRFAGRSLTVTDGPFTETTEVIAGFALWEVDSMEHALEWARKCPMMTECTVELRPVFAPEMFDPPPAD